MHGQAEITRMLLLLLLLLLRCSWPREFEGREFPNYVDWMRTCSSISVLRLPAISIPCGTTKSGEAGSNS